MYKYFTYFDVCVTNGGINISTCLWWMAICGTKKKLKNFEFWCIAGSSFFSIPFARNYEAH